MTKYITRRVPRSYYLGADYEDSLTADEVIDSGAADDTDTGLLSADGGRIYRTRETVIFGFVSGKVKS